MWFHRVGMQPFSKTIARLKQHYGEPEIPAAKTPFELVIWENACYLLSDERRLEVFESLRRKVGLNAAAILKAPDEVLLPLAKRGGMLPETRVFRWREIARITQTQFAGDLSSILAMPYAKAKKALKQFPTIGDPGAEKVTVVVRSGIGVAIGIERPEGAGPHRLGPAADELFGHLPLCSGRSETRPSCGR